MQKKKPLKWAENIEKAVTDGIQGEMIYVINDKIINLSKPLMTEESIELLESIMYSPLDPTDRSIDNLYKILLENDIDELKDATKFSNFFTEFMYLIDKEKKNLPI